MLALPDMVDVSANIFQTLKMYANFQELRGTVNFLVKIYGKMLASSSVCLFASYCCVPNYCLYCCLFCSFISHYLLCHHCRANRLPLSSRQSSQIVQGSCNNLKIV